MRDVKKQSKRKPNQHSVVRWWARSLKMWERRPADQSVTDAGESDSTSTVNF